MRLAVVNHHGGKPSGAEQSLLLFLRQLPPDITPVIVLFEGGEFADQLRNEFSSVHVVPMASSVKSTTRSSLKWSALAASASLVWRVAALLRRSQADCVLTNSVKAHVIGSIAARMVGIPVTNFMHDVLAGRARTTVRLLSKYFATTRLACSHIVDRNLRLPRTTVVHAPLNVDDYRNLPTNAAARTQLGLPNDGIPVVGLVGRIVRWKGQDRFLRIAARVLEHTDAHFAIIGGAIFACEPEYPAELDALIAQLGIAHRVHFVGWQSDPRAVYAALDVCCNCSMHEPFGRTTAEALACGVPTVCFDDGGACEIFEQDRGGTKIVAGDETAFAAAIVAYLDGTHEREFTRSEAQAAARKLDTAELMPKFLAALGSQRPASSTLSRESLRSLR